ncbi:MAG: glycosyltransferase [Bacteroidales bacterium]|nr:glycosyltransferase [Bacteroidales bacterium]
MIFTYAINVIEILLFSYLGFASIYFLFFSIASHIPKKDVDRAKPSAIRSIAVLIPGYKEDNVILDVAKDALEQNYPKDFFDVIVIADSFKKETLIQLKTLPIKVIEVSFDKSTKSKALNKAMEILPDKYDIAVILDADNIMAGDFLNQVNKSFNNGYQVVQGHRKAKNLNTSFAVLDAISEEINNSIFRKGHRAVGLSSALIGSGMAFSYSFFKTRMASIKAIGGFDKELELTLLRDGYKIDYLDNAIIYDEKVQKADVFANQRRRWLSAQFVYFRRFFGSGLIHLLTKGNIDFFDKVYQMISPPRVLLLGSTGLLLLASAITSLSSTAYSNLIFGYPCWGLLFVISFVALILATPPELFNKKTTCALKALPKAIFIMYKSLFRLKGANKKFIHTSHGAGK